MKTFALRILMVLGFVGLYSQAGHAQAALSPDGSVGQCYLSAKVKISSVHILVGGNEGWGRGKVICNYVGGGSEEMFVILHMQGAGVGFGASTMHADMISGAFGITEQGIKSLLGSYVTSKVNVAIGPVGGEFSIGLALQRDQQAIPVDLKGKVGVGLEGNVDLVNVVTILPEDGRQLPDPGVL